MKHLPNIDPGEDGIAPVIPKGGYAEDYRDDWISVVSRRLARRVPDLNSGQRKVLASIAFQARYRKEMQECKACNGNGWYLTSNDEADTRCELCHGAGQVGRATVRYIGRDARTRPVVERLEYGKWHRWAIGREGQPVDPAEPITKGKLLDAA